MLVSAKDVCSTQSSNPNGKNFKGSGKKFLQTPSAYLKMQPPKSEFTFSPSQG